MNLNTIGTAYGTLTGLPLCFPGIICGNKLIIRSASFSNILSGPLERILDTKPSLSMTNNTKSNRPSKAPPPKAIFKNNLF